MYISIEPNPIEKVQVLYYNVSCIDYSLMLETENGSINIDRLSLAELNLIKEAIDKFIEKQKK